MGRKLPYNKKGVSTIVITVILIGLTIGIGATVWAIVNNITQKQLGSAEACSLIFDKVKINPLYTCYYYTGTIKRVVFSIEIGDIDVDSVIVSILAGGTSKTYTITNNTAQQITDLKMYSGSGDLSQIVLPPKNSGLTYNATSSSFSSAPDLIRIAPKINGKQCDASDSISQIESCSLIV
jgi:hypothetical protein